MKHQRRRLLCFLCTSTLLISTSLWQAQASDPKQAKQVLDTYITVVSKVYPPAGGVMGTMVKMLEFTGYFGSSPDPVGEALKAINTRLDDQQQQINKLSAGLDELREGQMGERNWNRFTRLQDSRNDLQTISETLATKPTDKASKTKLVGDARAVAARFLDLEMWKWSDRSLKDQTWTNRLDKRRAFKNGEFTDPDFKSVPTLEYYTTALAVWMATMEYASGGDAAAIQQQYGPELQKHIYFLTRRSDWKEMGGEPDTLPEHVMDRVRGGYEPEKYPRDGVCHIWQYIRDDMRRNVEFADQTITYTAVSNNELCNVPASRRNSAPEIERNREKEYGLEVMVNLAKLLTTLRDKGTLRGAGTISTSTGTTSTTTPVAEPFTGRHKAIFEDKGFATGVGKVEDNILYGVRQDGTLIWHHHFIDFRKKPVRHSFAATKKVGDGWRSGFQGVFPAGEQAIYTLDDEGNLRWHWHHGAFDGKYSWVEPSVQVATGWSKQRILPMDHGVVYTISKSGVRGVVTWHRHIYYRNGAKGVDGWDTPKDVKDGFGQYLYVFPGGNGVLYAVGLDGVLYWYRHKDYLKPYPLPETIPQTIPAATRRALENLWAKSWEGPIRVGDGWNAFTKIFSPGEGHIYGILPNGDLMYYKHTGWQTGKYEWDESVKGKIASGWDGYVFAFARIITGDRETDQPK